MSWSVSATGKAPAVGAEIERQFSGGVFLEPEETVRQAARALISAAVAAQDTETVIAVAANGSQNTNYTTKAISNQISLSVQILHGFIE